MFDCHVLITDKTNKSNNNNFSSIVCRYWYFSFAIICICFAFYTWLLSKILQLSSVIAETDNVFAQTKLLTTNYLYGYFNVCF